jgi:hypothetical protein
LLVSQPMSPLDNLGMHQGDVGCRPAEGSKA